MSFVFNGDDGDDGGGDGVRQIPLYLRGSALHRNFRLLLLVLM